MFVGSLYLERDFIRKGEKYLNSPIDEQYRYRNGLAKLEDLKEEGFLDYKIEDPWDYSSAHAVSVCMNKEREDYDEEGSYGFCEDTGLMDLFDVQLVDIDSDEFQLLIYPDDDVILDI
ncbi:MAG: hypothetical protein K6B41_11390 [Butyrivibrio sp.]|nr:hypothetical protein [Butyrivibrio sp.]